MVDLQTKLCTNCNIEKPYSEFYKNKGRHLGLACYCKKCDIEHTIKWQRNNAEKFRIKQQKWRENNPEKEKEKSHKWREANLGRCSKRVMKWQKNKRKTDPKFRLNCNISCLIRATLKNGKGGSHWEEIARYTLSNLKKHLEKQFKDGMTWDNYGKGGWEIDHKIPVSVFNFTKPEHEDFKRCWALSNLQPMWKKDNIVKSNKLNKHFQPSLQF